MAACFQESNSVTAVELPHPEQIVIYLMGYFFIFWCAMLFAGKVKQQEVVLQEEVVVENTKNRMPNISWNTNLLVQNCLYFFLCSISLNAYSCYFFGSIYNAGLRTAVCNGGTISSEKNDTGPLSKQ